MTRSSDRPPPQPEVGEAPLGAGWRARAAGAQEAALPDGRLVVSCPAPYGGGGLGRHLKETVEAAERTGHEAQCICNSEPHQPGGSRTRAGLVGALAPLARFSPAWRIWAGSVEFDRRAAAALPPSGNLIAFNGTAVEQFHLARRRGYDSLSLISANSHIRHVIRRHEEAHRRHPIERPWATHLLRRNLAEYQAAGCILVASDYIRDSFLAEGVAEERLVPFPLTPDPRYAPDAQAPATDTFEIVYIGSLQVHKGVPLLLEAFGRLTNQELRLVLVGGWKTRRMRRFIETAQARDPRISVVPGDPLPHLRRARLCVHPSYEDGFAYAPAEAMACGVPVIVSEDTGMKELINDERAGLVVPSGDADALSRAIDAAARGEILTGDAVREP
jgi:glycosyltransferase involved in cell wall biosynthesis